MRIFNSLAALTPLRTILCAAQGAQTNTRLILQELRAMNETVTSELELIKTDVAALKTAVGLVATAATANAAALAAALEAAKNAGLTEAQLADFTAVHSDLSATTAVLQAIVAPPAPADTPVAGSGSDSATASAAGDSLAGGQAADSVDGGAA